MSELIVILSVGVGLAVWLAILGTTAKPPDPRAGWGPRRAAWEARVARWRASLGRRSGQ